MVRKCSIIGCRGNYAQRLDDSTNNRVTVFRFPVKDRDRLREWLYHIPQELDLDGVTENMGVCEKHFDSRFIIRDYSARRPDGTTISFPRDAPILSSDAIPTVFPNTPSYCSTELPRKRKHPDERRADMSARDDNNLQQWMDNDSISNFSFFKCNLNLKHFELCAEWMIRIQDDFITFVYADLSSCPVIVCSLKVKCDMTVVSFDSKEQRDSKELHWLLGDECRLARWSQIPNLCSFLKNVAFKPNLASSRSEQVNKICASLQQLAVSIDADDGKVTNQLTFICEQLQLMFMTSKRYSPGYLLFAFRVYCYSRLSYSFLRDSCLTLPHVSYLRRLSSIFVPKSLANDDNVDEHLAYLKQKCSLLGERERICTLLIDEIYVKPSVTYKGGSLQGFAENSLECIEATTVQAFMLSSITSKQKDIAALLPVKHIDRSFLQDSIMKVLRLTEKAGYRVIAIISDNNRVNRNSFEKLCGGELRPSIQHPLDPTRQLFFLFDSVHLLKCIRNNWINQHDQSFRFPQPLLLAADALCTASFGHLKQLYDTEQNNIVKLAPGLTFTALHPNNIQRQNVNLALKIFDDKNIAALDHFGKSISCDFSGTQNFISTILTLWKIVNVKHPLKGQRLNDQFCEPLLGLSDQKLTWLQSFYAWLCSWEGCSIQQRQGVLSRETMFALKHTVLTFQKLSCYLLTNKTETNTPGNQPLKYVLLGKFQTDNLELRFGLYRRMSGTNYNISVTQIMESEKKLRLMSVMKLVSCGDRVFTLTDFIASFQSEIDYIDHVPHTDDDDNVKIFSTVVDDCDDLLISDGEISGIVFIAGFVGYKMKAKIGCIDCRVELMTERVMECDYPEDKSFEYIAKIDRGRLTWPTDLMVDIVVQSVITFKCLISKEHVKSFSTTQKQRSVMMKLALSRCTKVLSLDHKCLACNTCFTELAKMCIKTVSNICLNNFAKSLADCKTKSKTYRKLSTLTK